MTPDQAERWQGRRRMPCLRWAEATIGDGARIVRVRVLPGWSAAVHSVVLTTDRGPVQAVIKRYVKPWVRDEPHVPGNEVAALRLLQGTAIPVPRLFGAELVATACDAPAVLMSRVAGRPRASAQVLAASIPR
nr:hypothetical protein [Chloroflexota bacterium]